jgi:predicted nucleic acid-binding protein
LEQLIVADSSPLISFARAGKLHIIHMVYSKIIFPSAVYEEIVINGKGKPGAEEIRLAGWIKIEKPMN